MIRLMQLPIPGKRLIHHAGDTITVTLQGVGAVPGQALLRTNIGRAAIRRREIIRRVEDDTAFQFRDWHDVAMLPGDNGDFTLTLPLAEVGRFEAKACFLPEGESEPLWPPGENLVIKVEPAVTIGANTLYTAFVRQFGPNKAVRTLPRPELAGAIEALDHDGYTVIPRSGTFRDLIGELDHIIDTLGFRILQLLPVHPVPTTYARMGRFGSPFASLDFLNVDPALAEFDRRTTPLEQFRELADAVHSRGHARLFIDLPINHTGWASELQSHHPEWFKRRHDETFQSPGAWGVTWEDLSELDFKAVALWRYMAGVFLFWCRQGVDGFRCDAGYMVPSPVWEYITARVRECYPDTVFLLEGLGGKISVMNRLLDHANLNWAYSELFQCHDRNQIEHYLGTSAGPSAAYGTLMHFAETHDNNRLAATSPRHARMRTALAALLANSGAFGITGGVEWFATEKLDVHGDASLNWGAENHQVALIARLTHLLAVHPAFMATARVRMIQQGDGNVLALHRQYHTHELLILVNLDAEHPQTVRWDAAAFPIPVNRSLYDGLADETCRVEAAVLELAPGACRCLVPDRTDWPAATPGPAAEPAAVVAGRQRALALQAAAFLAPDQPRAAQRALDHLPLLTADPLQFCERVAQRPALTCVTLWNAERDTTRITLLPRHHLLLATAAQPFRARLECTGMVTDQADSLQVADGSCLTLLFPPPAPPTLPADLTLGLSRYDEGTTTRLDARLLLLDSHADPQTAARVSGTHVRQNGHGILLTNGRGAMTQLPLRWGELGSKYDALLAANLHPDFPVDRHILWRRCRIWLVCRGYSQALDASCTTGAEVIGTNTARWHFQVPAGLGKLAALAVTATLCEGLNRITLTVARHAAEAPATEPEGPVRIILRPDLEDRNAHHVTKAFTGPEFAWPGACRALEDGFVFEPSPERRLFLQAASGTFTAEPEWQYMVYHPLEAERGLEAHTDIFSPGWFEGALAPGDQFCLTGTVNDGPLAPPPRAPVVADGEPPPPLQVLRQSMRQFIVKRDDTRTVIAGYPWFLDWGRDTLICMRGIIAAGLLDEARDILIQFARLEQEGTLPNMIRGGDDSNRDTSDAPLWFFRACADLMDATGDHALPDTPCGKGRTIREVLHSIARHYRDGTPNGIRMDPASGLVFSPSHYTWMDTNYPAGTPREGYPVEIQALWVAALTLMQRLDARGGWQELADQAAAGIATLFVSDRHPWLSDCLHGAPGTPAAQARADDHLRPNQLLAVTLGALRDPDCIDRMLGAAGELLVPGAIRSLADRPVQHPLPIRHDGRLLNDPAAPYAGTYTGDEDTHRKPAYHNGTAWTWLFPSYPEALLCRFGAQAAPTARALLHSGWMQMGTGCLNQIPEIRDGNAPHAARGCSAQAWGVTELYRVWKRLDEPAFNP